MKFTFVRLGLMVASIAFLSGCGGGGSPGGVASPGTVSVVVGNTDATSAHGVFDAFLALGGNQPVVSIASPPAVNFAVHDSSGKPVPGLKLGGSSDCGGNNVEFAMAKFDAANSGWQSLIAAAGAATVDPVAGATLEEKTGYYTYHFATDVGVDKSDPNAHYRIALALCFVDPQTQATVKANPYFDFTLALASDGTTATSVPQTDANSKLGAYKQVVDKTACDACHSNVTAPHDDRFVDPSLCVICHGPASTNAAGNIIDFRLLVHRLHNGKNLNLTPGYSVNPAVATSNGIKLPQDIRNCIKCHVGSASTLAYPATAPVSTQDGNNWMMQPGKNACWGCHDDMATWQLKHSGAFGLPPTNSKGGRADDPTVVPDNFLVLQPDSTCVGCHSAANGYPVAVNVKHAIPGWSDGDNYRYNISATATAGSVTLQFSVSDATGTTAYNIADPKFAALTILLGWGSGDYDNLGAVDKNGNPILAGQPVVIKATDAACVGNICQIVVPVPPGAAGTGVAALKGPLALTGANGPYSARVKDAVAYFAVGGGAATPRRTVVASAQCNACHSKNINGHGDHSGTTEPAVCTICHNGNYVLTDAATGDGTAAQPDWGHFKRLIHAVHRAQAQLGNYPVNPSSATPSGTAGLKNCNICHANNSYKKDLGVIGSSTSIANGGAAGNPVISPKAATCSACHLDPIAQKHMIDNGGAVFGTATQADLAAGKVVEMCDSCHSPGGLAAVDAMHGLQ